MENDQLISRTTYFLTSSAHDEEFVRHHIAELRTLLIEHNKHYYQTSDPLISDGEYDQLFALLVDRENRFSELVVPESPTQRLVGQVIE
jgi:DNA ligase (NAD+)